MARRTNAIALAIVSTLAAAPASAAILTLPFIGDVVHPDFDPLHIITPEAPPPAAPAPMPKSGHRRHHLKKM